MSFHSHDSDKNVVVAAAWGVNKNDLIKVGTDFVETKQRSGNDLEDAILRVAKMMGVGDDDIIKYGLCPSDNSLTETDSDKIKRLLDSD